jgi:hypothetical protein
MVTYINIETKNSQLLLLIALLTICIFNEVLKIANNPENCSAKCIRLNK